VIGAGKGSLGLRRSTIRKFRPVEQLHQQRAGSNRLPRFEMNR